VKQNESVFKEDLFSCYTVEVAGQWSVDCMFVRRRDGDQWVIRHYTLQGEKRTFTADLVLVKW